jgi:eukaryotic-like serine/threonine-protein kinase
LEIAPGTLLKDRYRIIELLGQGGMGAVHLAYDTSLDQKVAVKSNRETGETRKNQFLREAHILATLRHPNLPRVIDYFIADGVQYLVMDYIPGNDLEDIFKASGRQPLEKVLGWTRQLGSALIYLHSQTPPVIHRDIKPSNIKLTPQGEVILVDFGIAKASDDSQKTATGAVGYSRGYAPPEQYSGARTGPYSDQYSLAATIYTLLSGERPTDSLIRMSGDSQIKPIQQLNPGVPNHIQAALEKAMSIRPMDRFANIQDFLGALANSNFVNIQEAKTVAAYSSATISEAPPFVAPQQPARKNTWMMTCGIIAAVVLFLGVVGGGLGYYFFMRTPSPTAAALISTETADSIEIITETSTETPSPSSTPQEPTATGTDLSTQTTTPTLEPTSAPTPLPLGNGGIIAFASDRADGETFQIWTMKAYQTIDNQIIAGDLTQVTFDSGDKHAPDWSPDGRKILYVAPDPDGSGTQIFSINITNPDNQPVMLTNLNGQNIDPAWSPDGNFIVFSNFGRYNDVYMMYMMNADGSNLRRLSLDYQEHDPTWSPDQQWILYVISAESHDYFYLRSKEDDYATAKDFDPRTFFGALGEVDNPAWSPNGTYIAYTKIDGLSRHLFLTEFESRGMTGIPLTPNNSTEREPAWSPDSNWIAFTSERNNNPEIYIMTSTGLLQTNLTNDPAQDMEPDWE